MEQSAWAAAAVNFAVAAAAGAVSATAAIPVAKAFFDLHFGYPLCAPATERRGLHRRSSLKRQALQQHHRSLLLRLRSACLASLLWRCAKCVQLGSGGRTARVPRCSRYPPRPLGSQRAISDECGTPSNSCPVPGGKLRPNRNLRN